MMAHLGKFGKRKKLDPFGASFRIKGRVDSHVCHKRKEKGMLEKAFLIVILLGGPLVLCSCSKSVELSAVADLGITWELIENTESGFRSELTITNSGNSILPERGWSLYFNLARTITQGSYPESVEITRVNGDFYKLSPTESFPTLEPGEQLSIPFDGEASIVNVSVAPAGFYIVAETEAVETVAPVLDVTIKPWVNRGQTRRGPGDHLPVPTAQSRYIRNEALQPLPETELDRVIPTPLSTRKGPGQVEINAKTFVSYSADLSSEARFLIEALSPIVGTELYSEEGSAKEQQAITLAMGNLRISGRIRKSGSEAYRLTVDPKSGIQIIGTDPAGVFYGIQTLRAWLPVQVYEEPNESVSIDAVRIEDMPRFSYRGMHLDAGRNFQSRETVKRLLDLMAFYKLNRFHFHITDDEGWRLEIPSLPELTEFGSKRGHTETETDHLFPSFGSGPYPDPAISHGSGHYTRDDFVEILRYAHKRHIEVIPEIDVPGHARAAIRAMQTRYDHLMAQGEEDQATEFLLDDPEERSQYRSIQGWDDNVINVCLDSSYHFLATVVDEIRAMYQEAGAPLTTIHTGGDEVPAGVWKESPACAALINSVEEDRLKSPADLTNYFLRRFNLILKDRELVLAGWEEIALTGATHAAGGKKEPNPEFIEEGFRAYAWNSVWGWGGEENAYKLANAGYKVVLCNASNLYFDLAYNNDPHEIGYYWAGFVDSRSPWELIPLDLYRSAQTDVMGNPILPGTYRKATKLNRTGRQNIIGIQGQRWAENAKDREATEYLVFPKLLGLAERAWAQHPAWAKVSAVAARQKSRSKAWNRFANTLGQRDLRRLDFLHGGIGYRIPLPGAVVENGTLSANVAFPGLTIRYTSDGSQPTAASRRYTEPVEVSGEVINLKTFRSVGRSSRTTTGEGE